VSHAPPEIVEYTSPEETAVCNLASIALPRYVREKSQQVRACVRAHPCGARGL
jgi:hypothetical protein